MRLTVIGCGDAFNAGARLHSAYLLDHGAERMLVECGATTILGLKQRGIDTNAIPAIVISHLHGDHFAGLVWFFMDALFERNRTAPLAVYGPPGIAARVKALSDVLYPGLSVPLPFALTFHEMHAGSVTRIGGVDILPFEVYHPSGAPSHALRFSAAGKVLAFSGDAGWTDALLELGRGADLYLMECVTYDTPLSMHLNWVTIARHLDRIEARRIVLTHLAADMLAKRDQVRNARVSFAEDGAVFSV